MKNQNYQFGILIFFIFSGYISLGQHIPLYTQYLFNGLVINPAYGKGEDGITATGFYKKQWVGGIGSTSTVSATLHNSLEKEQYNWGLILFHDEFELKTQNDVLANYAFRISTGKGKLGLGLSGGLSFINYDRNKIIALDKDDEVLENLYGLNIFPKIGTGFYYHDNNLFAGISIPQWLITTSNENMPSLFKRVSIFNAGYKMHLNETFTVQPSFLVKHIGGSPIQVDYTLMFLYNNIINTGISYRMNTFFQVLFQLTWDRYTVGYAYDLPDSKVSSYAKGSHEIMVRYNIKYGLDLPDPKRF